ncbi:MAG TPA: hypothetical protein VGF48_15670 [Thermoanaerobaculia bacterium]|jgi:hypothetical protein
MATFIRTVRYLALVRAFPKWLPVAFITFGVYGASVTRMGGVASSALYLYLILIPAAAGTGIVHTGREGKLDLLIGSGVGRRFTWTAAWTRAVLLPSLSAAALAVLLSPMLDVRFVSGVFLTTLATGSIGFGFGVFRGRDAAGVLWIVARLAFMYSPYGRTAYAHAKAVEAGTAEPQILTLNAVALAVPEVLLGKTLPSLTYAGITLLAGAALVLSWRLFAHSDFGGHRAN